MTDVQQAVPVAQEDRNMAEEWRDILCHRDSEFPGDPVAALAEDFARHRIAARLTPIEGVAASGKGCRTCGGSRIINYAESTCQPAHQGPCPSCVGVTIATFSAALTPDRLADAGKPIDATQTREAEGLDWRKIAKLAGEHGVRYRTNASFAKFLAALSANGAA
jgi:hypothetical protein